MKFICDSSKLVDILSKLYRVLPKKVDNEILNGVKIQAKGEFITLTATDNDISVFYTMSASVIKEGSLIITGKYLEKYLVNLKGNLVFESYDNRTCKITHVESDNSIEAVCIDPLRLQIPENINCDLEFNIKSKSLNRLLNKTKHAAGNAEKNTLFASCFLKKSGNKISAVATDSYQMAYVWEPANFTSDDFYCTIPTKTVEILLSFLEDNDTMTHVCLGKNQIMFQINDTKIISLLVNAPDRDYDTQISRFDKCDSNFVIITKDLIEAIRRVKIVVEQSTSSNCDLNINENELIISADSQFVKESTEKLPILTNGKDINFFVSINYLENCIKCSNSMALKFLYTTPNSPIYIQSYTDENHKNLENMIYVFVPTHRI